MTIDRVLKDVSVEHEVFTLLTMLYSIPRNLSRIEALAVFPGQGELWRIEEAIEYWERGFGRYLLVAGDWDKYPNEIEVLIRLGLKRLQGVYIERYAQITPDQAGWLLDKCQELNVSSTALFTSPFYLFRAYSTLIGMMIKGGRRWVSVVPMPVAVSPDRVIPETGASAWDMSPGELERIIQYQKKGDVCSFDQLKRYISWLWNNFLKGEEDV